MTEKHAHLAVIHLNSLLIIESRFPGLRARADQAVATARSRLSVFESHPERVATDAARHLRLDRTQFLTVCRKLCVWTETTVDVVTSSHRLCVETIKVVRAVDSELVTLGRFRAWSLFREIRAKTADAARAFSRADAAVQEVEAAILTFPTPLR